MNYIFREKIFIANRAVRLGALHGKQSIGGHSRQNLAVRLGVLHGGSRVSVKEMIPYLNRTRNINKRTSFFLIKNCG